MGQTVVFTVALDDDNVAIERREPRPPRRTFRDSANAALRDRHWHLALAACFVIPAVAAAVTFAITRGAWVTTAALVAAALVTPASGAWAGNRGLTGDWGARVAAWAVTGLAGAALALASVPLVIVTALAEEWDESAAVPTLSVLAISGAGGAWFGLALGLRERAWNRAAAAVATVVIALAPLGVAAALLPRTSVTEAISSYGFTATYAGNRPAYLCSEETVQVTRQHSEDVAWIAFASPLAWVVDAPQFTAAQLAAAPDGTVAQAQAWTRSSRVGPDDFVGYCYKATSLGRPLAVQLARYETAGPIGATVAVAFVGLVGAIALYGASRRRSA
ncbi:hypothetical protein [Demequina sp.]|uniref:hypothetical protein n=1 Tax=Demequina sp. TaxID=2050685 RepID=UPI003D0E72B6